MSDPGLRSFDELLGEDMDDASKNFWWALVSPIVCDCKHRVDRDEARFGFDKSGPAARLFVRCRCDRTLTLHFTF